MRLSTGKFMKKNEFWPQHITFLAILLGYLVFFPSPYPTLPPCKAGAEMFTPSVKPLQLLCPKLGEIELSLLVSAKSH